MRKIIKTLVMIWLLSSAAPESKAQLNAFQAMYFQNPYLYNPAMAGLNPGMNLNLGYRQQWTNFPGAPKTAALTLDYRSGAKVGLGINVNDEQSGLLRQTRVMGSYAYHVPLSDRNQKLNFGLSLGVNDSRVNRNQLNGDETDDEIAIYNQLKPYVDGDFGIAYTSEQLNISGAVPNLKSVFFKSSDERFDVDRLLFITVVSYKFGFANIDMPLVLEPLVALRVVKGNTNIMDYGFNLDLTRYGLYLQGIYHTSRSMGVGFGLDQQTYAFSFSYNLETGLLGNYTQGAFELGIKLRLFGN
jgi:type IX secretion system PorP/SprF family membrane protein